MKNYILALLSLFMFTVTFAKEKATPVKVAVTLEKATFAAGCFWGVEEFFRKVPGVEKTMVGYAGGTKANPSYKQVGSGQSGHAETVQIEFDSSKVSFENLLNLFFKMHDPTTKDRQGNDQGSQYRSAIFYNSPDQMKTAQEFIAKVEKSKAWKSPIVTQVASAGPFYPAEEEHQKYLVKNPGGYDNHYLRSISFDK